jgi:hypothetical protein
MDCSFGIGMETGRMETHALGMGCIIVKRTMPC